MAELIRGRSAFRLTFDRPKPVPLGMEEGF